MKHPVEGPVVREDPRQGNTPFLPCRQHAHLQLFACADTGVVQSLVDTGAGLAGNSSQCQQVFDGSQLRFQCVTMPEPRQLRVIGVGVVG